MDFPAVLVDQGHNLQRAGVVVSTVIGVIVQILAR
jgi:hypothetical protein